MVKIWWFIKLEKDIIKENNKDIDINAVNDLLISINNRDKSNKINNENEYNNEKINDNTIDSLDDFEICDNSEEGLEYNSSNNKN